MRLLSGETASMTPASPMLPPRPRQVTQKIPQPVTHRLPGLTRKHECHNHQHKSQIEKPGPIQRLGREGKRRTHEQQYEL